MYINKNIMDINEIKIKHLENWIKTDTLIIKMLYFFAFLVMFGGGALAVYQLLKII